MPVLNDRAIMDAIRDRKLVITPLIRNNVQPGSVDLTLDKVVEEIVLPDVLDVSAMATSLAENEREVDISEGYVLKPGKYVRGHSAEYMHIPDNVIGMLSNRNSLALIGIDAAISSFANPGFKGKKTIVIRNFGDSSIVLRSGMRICQISFFEMTGGALRSYEDRHDETLMNHFTRQNFPSLMESVRNVDDSLSEFLENSIRKAASRK